MTDAKTIKAKGRPMLHWEGKTAALDLEYYPAQEKEVYGDKDAAEFNKIFWGDNFQVLSHLLKDYKGKIDLIYIDPPFDSKADYVKTIKLRGQQLSGREQSAFEQKQYSDIWDNDDYLQFMYERLLLLRELLADTGSIYLHCDWHKAHHLRCLLDEVFGYQNFLNQIIWKYDGPGSPSKVKFAQKHDYILRYAKDISFVIVGSLYTTDFINDSEANFSVDQSGRYFYTLPKGDYSDDNIAKLDSEGRIHRTGNGTIRIKYFVKKVDGGFAREAKLQDVWSDIASLGLAASSIEKTNYPTQKPEGLIERIITSSTSKGDLVLDCFMGSGTTCAVAQKLDRRWIGCDINTGAVQTTTKRLNKILEEHQSDSTPNAFKVLNVNEYNTFKNKEEGIAAYKTILLEAYGVPSVRGYFDGRSSQAYVKIIDPNRLLNRKDIDDVLSAIDDTSDAFILSKSPLRYYEVQIICSGKEPDIDAYIKRTNKTQVSVAVRDVLIEKEGLIFKEPPYMKCNQLCRGRELTITIEEFISPVLIKKLDIDQKVGADKALIEDFKQAIDSIAIDIDYDGKLFNAEIIDVPAKKADVVKATYTHTYKKAGTYTIAIKVIDILGEELFEVFECKVN